MKKNWKNDYHRYKECKNCKHLITTRHSITKKKFITNHTCDLVGVEYDCVKKEKGCFEANK